MAKKAARPSCPRVSSAPQAPTGLWREELFARPPAPGFVAAGLLIPRTGRGAGEETFSPALTQHLTRQSTFGDSRRAVELVARTLFRNDSANLRNARLNAVAAAFDSVGISTG